MKEKGLRWIVMTLSAALSIVIMILLLFMKQRDIALSNERMAKATSNVAMLNVATAQSQVDGTQRQATIARAEELATQSLYVQDKKFPLSLLLGIEAYKTFETPITRSALLQGAEVQPQLLRFLADDATPTTGFAFSPDSKTLAVEGCDKRKEMDGCAQSTIRFWNVSTGQSTGQITSAASIVFSPDGKTLALGNSDGSVTLKDVATLEMIGQPLRGSNVSRTPSLDFSPDGKILAIESWVGVNSDVSSINLWDVASQKLIGSLQGIPFGPYSLAFSSDGKTLLFLGWTNELIGWNVATQTRVKEPQFQGNTPSLGEPALSADGKIAAFAPFRGEGIVQEGGIILWDTTTGKPIGETLVGFSNLCGRSLAFSPDSKKLASGCNDGTIILWDLVQNWYVTNPEQLTGHPLKGHTGTVWSLIFSPDGKTLASSGDDGAVILWGMSSQVPLGQQLKSSSDWLESVAFSPDGKTVAAGDREGAVVLWDVPNRQSIGKLISDQTKDVSSVVFSPDGKTLAVGNRVGGSVMLWDVATQHATGVPLLGNSDGMYTSALAFSPDGRTLATANSDQTVLLWNVSTGKQIGSPLLGHTGSVYTVAFSPDGMTLASGSEDGTIILWDVATHKSLAPPLTGNSDYVLSVVFSPDGKMLASGSRDGTIILWDVGTRQAIGQPLDVRLANIFSLAFSPDGRTLASGSANNSVILWDVETHQRIAQPLAATEAVSSVAFSPDGKLLASGSWDGNLILWDIQPQSWIASDCQRAGRNFTQPEWQQYFPDEAYRVTCPDWPSGTAEVPASMSTAAP